MKAFSSTLGGKFRKIAADRLFIENGPILNYLKWNFQLSQ
jgi:hypothetical protein